MISGPDSNDNYTQAQPSPVADFTAALDLNAFKGKRIGVPRHLFLDNNVTGNDPYINVAFKEAIQTIKNLGATIVDPADLPSAEELIASNNQSFVLLVDLKVNLSNSTRVKGLYQPIYLYA